MTDANTPNHDVTCTMVIKLRRPVHITSPRGRGQAVKHALKTLNPDDVVSARIIDTKVDYVRV